jgi:hypothetical protein
MKLIYTVCQFVDNILTSFAERSEQSRKCIKILPETLKHIPLKYRHTFLRLKRKSIYQFSRKSCENGMIFAKFPFAEIFVFAKILAKISRKFRDKSIKFDSDTACMVHVVKFFSITSNFRRIKRHMWGNVRIQLPLGPKQKISRKWKIFAKTS